MVAVASRYKRDFGNRRAVMDAPSLAWTEFANRWVKRNRVTLDETSSATEDPMTDEGEDH